MTNSNEKLNDWEKEFDDTFNIQEMTISEKGRATTKIRPSFHPNKDIKLFIKSILSESEAKQKENEQFYYNRGFLDAKEQFNSELEAIEKRIKEMAIEKYDSKPTLTGVSHFELQIKSKIIADVIQIVRGSKTNL